MTAPTVDAIPTGTWKLDPLHSIAGFAIKHQVVNTFRSRFTDVNATLVAGDGEASLTGTVQVASLDIADEGFRAHLLGDDFFAADRYPAIAFASQSILRTGSELVVAGELEIKGIARRVEARGTIADGAIDPFDNVRLGVSLTTTIDRTEYGLAWNRRLVTGGFAISDRVDLTLDLAFIRA
jgi:polyisoprenoid-binding protein YceI